ncbi:MAG: ABC transporter ATP-binding protein [Candidatus Hydrogenedentes bacterium]|nr:ABC transporter ATP-binding protein [Candidatus Hydrogenedentota bacterium]
MITARTDTAKDAQAASKKVSSPWPAYSRLLGYVLRYKSRLAAMVVLSIVVGASLGSIVLSVGHIVNTLYLEEDEFEERFERTKARVTQFADTLERYTGWAPKDPESRAEELIRSLRDDRTRALRLLAVIVVVLIVVGGISRFLLEYYASAIGVNVSIRLNEEMFDNILNLSHRFFERRTAGEVVARFTNDAFMVRYGLMDVLTRIFLDTAKIFFLLCVAMTISPFLTMVVLCVLAPILLVILGIATRVRAAVSKSLRKIASLATIVTEVFQGISVVKGFCMEKYERNRMGIELSKLRRHMKNLVQAQAAVGPATEILMIVGIGMFIILTEREITAGYLDPLDLVKLFGAIGLMLGPLRKLSRVMNLVQISATSGERVFEFIDYKPDVAEGPDAVDLPPIQDALRFEGVGFSYDGETKVLSGIDLELKRGEMVALVGFSGSGKSTIAKLILRFYDPDEGRITLDGVDIREATFESLRGQISIVTQETILFAETVRKNIAYGREGVTEKRVWEAARAAHADGFIREMPEAYDTPLAESGGNLSGGQRQRIAIARAIVKDPSILILDEATSSLDSESEEAILRAIDEFIVGRTTLVIAHRLSTVQKADRIVVLDRGRIVEQGTHQELLMKAGIYQRLYRLQFAAHKEAGAS